MPDLASSTPAISPFFKCSVDGQDLGAWSSCSGLSISISIQERPDTAREFVTQQVPGKVSFGNITLGRPVCAGTSQVMAWFNSFALNPKRVTAEIAALDQTGMPLTGLTWNLYGVMPVRWTGPSFDIESAKVPTEQLELAFKGFQP